MKSYRKFPVHQAPVLCREALSSEPFITVNNNATDRYSVVHRFDVEFPGIHLATGAAAKPHGRL